MKSSLKILFGLVLLLLTQESAMALSESETSSCYIAFPQGCPLQPGFNHDFQIDAYLGILKTPTMCKRRAHDYLEWCFAIGGRIPDGLSTVMYYRKNGQWTSAFVATRSGNIPYTHIYVRAGGVEVDEHVATVPGRP